MYRPVLEGVLTLTELKTTATYEDVIKINALLDMRADVQRNQNERDNVRRRI